MYGDRKPFQFSHTAVFHSGESNQSRSPLVSLRWSVSFVSRSSLRRGRVSIVSRVGIGSCSSLRRCHRPVDLGLVVWSCLLGRRRIFLVALFVVSDTETKFCLSLHVLFCFFNFSFLFSFFLFFLFVFLIILTEGYFCPKSGYFDKNNKNDNLGQKQ